MWYNGGIEGRRPVMKHFREIYLEISNICNLNCSFCPGTRRSKRWMTTAEMAQLLPKLRDWTDHLYFHLMGEPLLHPHLEEFLQMAGDAGLKVILTTNGTLLPKRQELLLKSPALHKINISLHAFEANDPDVPFETYLRGCMAFGQAAQGAKLVTYRLWNDGGLDEKNGAILDTLHQHFPGQWVRERRGIRMGQRVYLEHGEKFDWPDLSAADGGRRVFCYGLRDQIGVLADGTVVPCCLDHEGDLALGNLYQQELKDILDSPRAKAIYDGFSRGEAAEELCRKCGYARRFQK